ncbi:DinI family protein, partial [Kocuria sabuli]
KRQNMHVKCTCTLKKPQISRSGVFLFVTKGNKNTYPLSRSARLDTVYYHIKNTVYNHSGFPEAFMFVELVYDKRNVEGLEGAREIILAELTKRVHQIFPDAEVKVKPMQANALNSDASKSDREKLNRMLEEMFEEADMWLVQD